MIETSIFVKSSVSPPASSLFSHRTLYSDIPGTKYVRVFPQPKQFSEAAPGCPTIYLPGDTVSSHR